jgi:hypothetical protein
MRKLLLISGVASIAGCYVPNQAAFESSVHKHVQAGMPLEAAVSNLGQMKMKCSGAHVVTCDRLRQRLLPSSCVERVHLEVAQTSPVVEAVEVDPIICAGL